MVASWPGGFEVGPLEEDGVGGGGGGVKLLVLGGFVEEAGEDEVVGFGLTGREGGNRRGTAWPFGAG